MKKIYILLFALAAAVGMTGCTSEMPEKTADEGGDILIRLQVDAAAMVSYTSEGYKVNDSPRFVMTAEGGFEVGSGADAGKAVASLLLKRLASKVSLTITYAQDLGGDEEHPTLITTTNADGTTTVWTPMTEGNVRVYLQNAVSNATLGGFASSQTRFTYADVQPAGEPLKASAFYTYPPKWDEGSDNAPFIKIIQPWSYKTMKDGAAPGDPAKPVVVDESTVELYYKVIFPGMTELAGNTDYQFTVKLTVLGGESTRDMKEITPTGFSILPWGNTTGSDLSPIVSNPAKYLAVERDTTVANNGAGVSIRYVASGPATLTVNSIKKWVFDNTTMVEKSKKSPASDGISDVYSGSTVAAGKEDAWFKNTYPADPKKPNEGIITLTHKLSSELFDHTITNFAARPYEYDLTLHLDGESTDLDQKFHITQNPPFLVEGVLSTGFVSVNGITTNYGDKPRKRKAGETLAVNDTPIETGYYINPLYRDTKLYDFETIRKRADLGNVNTYRDLTDNGATTSNICKYRIIVSASPLAGKYTLDPRAASSSSEGDLNKIINMHKEGYSSTLATDNGYCVKPGNPLSKNATDAANIAKYKPGSKLAPAKDYIAPEIMFASSYGKTLTITYEQAVLRCMAYQEDGYPAGRWRLPTEAEISMCVELQNRGAIPVLFRTDVTLSANKNTGGYSAASGMRYIENAFHDYAGTYFLDGSRHKEIYAWPRCVYDTWYWGRKEVEALKDGFYTEGEGENEKKYQKYKWSGYGYTSK